MIVPDVNLLIYAYDSSSPLHLRAASWWQACLMGEEPVLLPEVVVFGFVRVSTNPRAFLHPLTTAEAVAHMRSWLQQGTVTIPAATPEHFERVLALLESGGRARGPFPCTASSRRDLCAAPWSTRRPRQRTVADRGPRLLADERRDGLAGERSGEGTAAHRDRGAGLEVVAR